MRFLFVALLLFFLLPAQALIVDYRTIMEIQGDTVIRNTMLSLENNEQTTVESLSFPLGGWSEIIVQNANYTNNTLHFSLAPNKKTNITITAKNNELISGSDAKIFLWYLNLPFETKNFEFSLVLPMGFVLNSQQSVSPQPQFFSDGQRIVLHWNEPSEQFSAKFGKVYELEQTIVHTPFFDVQASIPIIILAFIFGYFLSAGSFSFLFNMIRRTSAQLNDDEQKVVDALEKRGGQKQVELQKNLGFSKAKFSRLLRAMEERKLIKKEVKGKNNFIFLLKH